MRVSDEVLYKLVDVFRELRPEFVLSHSLHDPYNFDHPLATHVTQEARIIAQAHGHNPEQAVIGAPPVFCSMPHPTRTMQLEAGCVAGYQFGMGKEKSGVRNHECPGASVGVLHPCRLAARGAGFAQFVAQHPLW